MKTEKKYETIALKLKKKMLKMCKHNDLIKDSNRSSENKSECEVICNVKKLMKK